MLTQSTRERQIGRAGCIIENRLGWSIRVKKDHEFRPVATALRYRHGQWRHPVKEKDIQAINAIIKACIANADGLLHSAKDVRKPGRNHIAYHLAALALEEIGKATMIIMGSLTPESRLADEDHRSPADAIEDHEKKLFWALWTPAFATEKISVDEFRRHQDVARKIHETRLKSLYVDPSAPGLAEPTDEALDALLELAEARLEMDRLKEIRELDDKSREEIEWLFQATENPQMQSIVFSPRSLSKLTELQGDARQWVTWLRETVAAMELASREIMEREMNRAQPTGKETRIPKWQVNIRLKSWSHSMRAKPLSAWNKKSAWIKFFPNTANKNEILVQFTLHKTIPVQLLWQSGMQMSSMIVLAFNIGTVGFFWWYLPSFVSKFYEQILDLESKARVTVERSPQLVIAWPHQALKEAQLSTISLVLAHLIHIDQDKWAAYARYFQALGMLAKNDIFGQLEHTIVIGFYEALRSGMAAYRDWDGENATFEAAAESFIASSLLNSQLGGDLRETLRLCAELANQRTANPKITLDEVAKMKVYCDVYFVKKASQQMAEQARKEKAQPGTGEGTISSA